jgi:hypothetical protein
VDHRDTLAAALDLAALHYQQGRLDLMEPLVTSTLESLRRTAGVEDPTTLNAQNLLAILQQAQGRFDEAEQRLSLYAPAPLGIEFLRSETKP